LVLLAAGSIFAGVAGYSVFVGDGMDAFWGDSIKVLSTHTALVDSHHVPIWVKVLPLAMGVSGIALAYWMYIVNTNLPKALADSFRPLYLFSYNKWYFDELFNAIFVKPAFYLGRGLWKSGDGALIDGVGPDGVAALTKRWAQRASNLQSGYLYHYAFAMLIGIVGLVTWHLFTAAG